MVSESKHNRSTVYVIGAGFSAGLGFPLVHDLLVRLWPRLSESLTAELVKVIAFHHPGFDPKRKTSFPTIEQLLSEMLVNEQLFVASRPAEGNFKLKDLIRIRQDFLLQIAQWFHEIHEEVMASIPNWLLKTVDKIKSEKAKVISFNWDLVLDQMLFGSELEAASYGFTASKPHFPSLIKPHGSLNWFEGPNAKLLSREKRFVLHSGSGTDQRKVYAFKPYRSPVSTKRTYMPLIIPPVYGKTFELPIFEELWRSSVDTLSEAKRVVFLGYSLPDADVHTKFILRCGFHNQLDGKIKIPRGRTHPSGAADVIVVNPDVGSARRIEAAVGNRIDWRPTTVANWLEGMQPSN